MVCHGLVFQECLEFGDSQGSDEALAQRMQAGSAALRGDFLVTWSVQAMRPGHAMGIIYTSGTTGQPKAAGSPGTFQGQGRPGTVNCSCSDTSEVMIHHDAVVAQGAIGCLENTGILEGDFRQSQAFEQD